MAALSLLVLFRQDGHCGSRWIGEMLASQNVSVLFEFGGVCPERFAQKTIVSNDASKDVESIDNLVEGACSCAAADAQMATACPRTADGAFKSLSCFKVAYCSGRCSEASFPRACAAVSFVSTFTAALANRTAAARAANNRRVVVASLERDNAVKHAFSLLKVRCAGAAIRVNHQVHHAQSSAHVPGQTRRNNYNDSLQGSNQGARPTSSAAINSVSLVHVEPRTLLAMAALSLRGRRGMRDALRNVFGEIDVLIHYESVQRDEAGQLQRLTSAMGIHGFSPSLLQKSALEKSAPEDLRKALLNFDEVDTLFAKWPCLLRMLRSSVPERFDETGCALPEPAATVYPEM